MISSEMIYNSFKYSGISNSLNGSEKSLIKVYDKLNEKFFKMMMNKI